MSDGMAAAAMTLKGMPAAAAAIIAFAAAVGLLTPPAVIPFR